MTDTPLPIRQATTRDFLAVVFRQLWVIVAVFLIASLSVVVVSLRSPTNYESNSLVRVARGQKQSMLQSNLQVFPWEEEISTELETVKSWPVVERAQNILYKWHDEGKLNRKFRLSPSGVGAGLVGESNVIIISYNSRDAESCQPVTNAVTQAYMDYRHASATVPFVNEFFQREIGSVDSAMAAVVSRRQSYVSETGSVDPSEVQHSLYNHLQNMEAEQAQVREDIRLTGQSLSQGRQHLDNQILPDPGFFFQLNLGNQQVLSKLKDDLSELEQKRESLASRQTEDHPELKSVLTSLDEVRSQIRSEARASLDLLESRHQLLREQDRSISGQVASYREQLMRVPSQESALDQLDHEMQTLRERHKELSAKEMTARIQQATSPDWTVTLYAPAGRPKALRTTDYVRLALAPLLSLVVGLMLAFFLDSLDHSLKTAGDVEEYLGIPVLASLPETRS
ncbi:MAG: hypothetical protein SGI90_02925 [Candidatus Eisenbacteria bacterium]|nr:hypothetical protein [Candidatus Eisenbacteria bacterium]